MSGRPFWLAMRTMAHRIFIDGAAGTTGLEIASRLADRDEFELIELDDVERKNATARRDALNAADIAILCLPDDAARDAMSLLDPDGATRVIDASSAYRTAEGWLYGFPEIVGSEKLAAARRISNPGCYPTGFLGLLVPLLRAGLLPSNWPYTVHAVSGYSGGGKALIERFEGSDVPAPAFRTYGLALGHKHVPEMQEHAGLTHAPLFSPAVVNAYRGMIVEIPLPLSAMNAGTEPAHLRDCLADFYDGSPIVHVDRSGVVPEELLLDQASPPRDDLKMWVCGSADNGQARLIARLDNLGKGASGAAVQTLNLVCGLPETAGLRL